MGVERTDYLFWGVKIDPDLISWDDHEKEMDGDADRRFDIVYDGMGGKYAVAGKIVAKCGQHDGIEFQEVPHDCMHHDIETANAVKKVFPDAQGWRLFLFSHYH